MVKLALSYAIIIVGHFCKRGTICVSFLEQYVKRRTPPPKIFNDLQILSKVV
jgi:hypothetical protein